MRELFNIPSPRRYLANDDFTGLRAEIERLHPGAVPNGSCGCWVWLIGEKVVAEAWLAPRKPGWYFKISGNT